MAIKHIKNIQAKADGAAEPSSGASAAAAARQCFQVDQYREGYHECLTTAVQFLIEISAHFEEICYKMVNHLREHFNDVVKGDHCPNSNSSGNVGLNGTLQQQIKRRHQDNGSPLSTTTGSIVNGLGPLCKLANEGGNENAEVRTGAPSSSSSITTGTNGGTGPRVAHLCGSMNGHSSNSTTNFQGSVGESIPSSSDGQEINYAKDLSCRGGGANNSSSASAATMAKAPQQTPVITSTACSNSAQCSMNSVDLLVNVETESSSSALDHSCVMEEASVTGNRSASDHEHEHEHDHDHDEGRNLVGLGSGRGGVGLANGHLVKVHNLTDTSCDGVDHHYKYKNYMQQRFSHERYHDEHVVSNSSNELHDHNDHPIAVVAGECPGQGGGRCGGARASSGNNGPTAMERKILASSRGGAMAPPPVDITDSNCSVDTFAAFNAKRAGAVIEGLRSAVNSGGAREDSSAAAAAAVALAHFPVSLLLREQNQALVKEEKMDTSSPSEAVGKVLLGADGLTAARMVEGSQQMPRVKAKSRLASVPVPIFALHSHGSFYIPLTVDYDALVPYLGEVNLLDKNLAAIKALHPVNINIYTPF